jgi:hypothetical protein
MQELPNKGPAGSALGEGRYLLFDSGCSACTEIAQAVEKETDGWLTVRSLREDGVQEALNKARPGWKWEPTFLEVSEDRTIVFTGLSMKVHMLAGLGPRRAARVARAARVPRRTELAGIEMTMTPSESGPDRYSVSSVKLINRRSALLKMGAAGIGAALLPALSLGASPSSALATAPRYRRVRATRMTRAQVAQMIERVEDHPIGKKLHLMLIAKNFKQDDDESFGETFTGDFRGSSVYIRYDRVASAALPFKESAYLYFSSFNGKLRFDAAIANRDGDLEVYRVVDGQAKRVRLIRDYKSHSRSVSTRSGAFSHAATRAANSPGCQNCLNTADVIIGAGGCGLGGGAAAAILVCGAVTAGNCAFIAMAIWGLLCAAAWQWGVDGPSVVICESLGYCDFYPCDGCPNDGSG